MNTTLEYDDSEGIKTQTYVSVFYVPVPIMEAGTYFVTLGVFEG